MERWGWWGGVVFAAAIVAGCGAPEKSITGPMNAEPAMILPIKDAGAGQREVVLDSVKAPADMVLPIKCD